MQYSLWKHSNILTTPIFLISLFTDKENCSGKRKRSQSYVSVQWPTQLIGCHGCRSVFSSHTGDVRFGITWLVSGVPWKECQTKEAPAFWLDLSRLEQWLTKHVISSGGTAVGSVWSITQAAGRSLRNVNGRSISRLYEYKLDEITFYSLDERWCYLKVVWFEDLYLFPKEENTVSEDRGNQFSFRVNTFDFFLSKSWVPVASRPSVMLISLIDYPLRQICGVVDRIQGQARI
jgi:hypothetical protein